MTNMNGEVADQIAEEVKQFLIKQCAERGLSVKEFSMDVDKWSLCVCDAANPRVTGSFSGFTQRGSR